MSFGKRLKAIIKEEGLSQREFAKEVGFSQTAIEHYIAERRVPSGELFMIIGKHEQFRKYVIWLLTGEIEEGSDQSEPETFYSGKMRFNCRQIKKGSLICRINMKNGRVIIITL